MNAYIICEKDDIIPVEYIFPKSNESELLLGFEVG